MSKLKTTGIIIAIILAIACVFIDVWYLYIKQYGPEKIAVFTPYAGLQEAADGTTAYAFEFQYYSNANKNGYEMLASNITYLRDETASGFHSKGVQYEATSIDEKLDWTDYEKYQQVVSDFDFKSTASISELKDFKFDSQYIYTIYKGLWHGDMYAQYLKLNSKNERYEYQTDSLGNTTLNALHPITSDSVFTLQTNSESGEMLYLKFKGINYAEENRENNTVIAKDIKEGMSCTTYNHPWGLERDYNFYFYNIDYDYFNYLVYQEIKDKAPGTTFCTSVELGNYFNYYKVNPDGSVGEEIAIHDSTKVTNYIKSYFTIKVTVSADGARASSDSMFGYLHGSENYRIEGYTGTEGSYFAGQDIVDVSYKNFDFVKIAETDVALKLREDFISAWLPYKKTIALYIKIDTEEISNLGYTFLGFTSDSGLDNFKIYKTEVI